MSCKIPLWPGSTVDVCGCISSPICFFSFLFGRQPIDEPRNLDSDQAKVNKQFPCQQTPRTRRYQTYSFYIDRPSSPPGGHAPTFLVDVPLHVHHHGVETHQRRASHARRSSSARGKNVCLRDWGPTVAAPSALTRPLCVASRYASLSNRFSVLSETPSRERVMPRCWSEAFVDWKLDEMARAA